MLPIFASVVGTVLALLWISIPALHPFSLQLSAGLVLLYVLSVRFSTRRWLQLLPPKLGLHSALLTAAVGVLVGTTGGTHSPFFLFLPLTVFFCTLTLPAGAVILQTAGLSLILWVSQAGALGNQWGQLLLLPALLPVALLARLEMENSRQSQHAQWVASQHQERQTREAVIFLVTVLGPKIQSIQIFLEQSQENRPQVALQLQALQEEIRTYAHELELPAGQVVSPERPER